MKKLSSIGALVFAALVAGLAILSFSTPAQAYPEARIDFKVNRDTVYVGQKFTATGSSSGTTCNWTVEWNNKVRTGSSSDGHDFTTTFTAPGVRKVTRIPLDGTCMYSSASAPSARAAATWHQSITITVLPRSTAVAAPRSSSDLPNTGGPNLVFLLGGLALLASGATAVTVARRRAEEAELRVTQV